MIQYAKRPLGIYESQKEMVVDADHHSFAHGIWIDFPKYIQSFGAIYLHTLLDETH
jgi:hypothetical protein